MATVQIPLLTGPPGSAAGAYAALVSTSNIRALVPAFQTGADSFWHGIMRVPQDYNSTPAIILSLAANDTTGHAARMIVSTHVVASGASYDAAATAETAQNQAMPGTAYQRQDVTFSLSTTPTAGADIYWNVERNGTNGGDTLTVDVYLMGIVFQYST